MLRRHPVFPERSGLVQPARGNAANGADVAQVAEWLHGEENAVHADGGYTGVDREEHRTRFSGPLKRAAAKRKL